MNINCRKYVVKHISGILYAFGAGIREFLPIVLYYIKLLTVFYIKTLQK